ncbi:MAG: sodium:proton antiporter [Clostridiales bacterium]|nr:sodium:proton antiporter [Clostridiales bacterium]
MLLLAFVVANIIIFIYLLIKGYECRDLLTASWRGIVECKELFMIILLMGATISVWLSSGIVPSLIYYGFGYMKSINLVLTAFISTAIVSYMMGTALGTLSTIGIALLGIGKGLMIPAPVLLGAIVSGSFIADKIAPISSLTNLNIHMTGIDYKRYLKSSLKTLVPSIFISSVIYYLLGNSYGGEVDVVLIQQYRSFISETFNITPLLLLFPLFVVIMAFCGIKTVYNMSISVAVASLITLFIQKSNIWVTIQSILWGYKANTGMTQLDSLISGGGAMPMVEVVLIVMGSITLSSMLGEANMIKPITDTLFKRGDKVPILIAKTGILSTILNVITCDQTVGILVPAKFVAERFDDWGLDRSILARTISDTGTIIAPLMFWNVNAIIIYGITEISAISYAPYGVLCYVCPLVTVISSLFLAKSIAKVPSRENKQLVI